MERWRARSVPVQEHFESLEPVLALRFVAMYFSKIPQCMHVLPYRVSWPSSSGGDFMVSNVLNPHGIEVSTGLLRRPLGR